MPTLSFVLELDSGADPIAGSVRKGSREFPFVGWLGLATALERARAELGERPISPPGGVPPAAPRER